MISTAQIAKSAFAPSVFVTSLFGPNMRTKFEKTQPDIATRIPVRRRHAVGALERGDVRRHEADDAVAEPLLQRHLARAGGDARLGEHVARREDARAAVERARDGERLERILLRDDGAAAEAERSHLRTRRRLETCRSYA